MRAIEIFKFGPPDVVATVDTSMPEPAEGQLLVQVRAAGVGPWDVLVREGTSGVPQSLPLTLGAELSGTVEQVGPGVKGFQVGDDVFGDTNPSFTGAYADYAVASAGMMASKPKSLSFIEAASAPVGAVTAWQMLFEYAELRTGQSVLVHGSAGNVGGYAVQLGRNAGLKVIATAGSADVDYVRSLGATTVVDYKKERFERVIEPVDAVLDTVGGETRDRSFGVLKPGGILVSTVSPVPEQVAAKHNTRGVFFIVNVTTGHLRRIAELFEAGKLVTDVGTILPLDQARTAHEMLGGKRHPRGKIVLDTMQN